MAITSHKTVKFPEILSAVVGKTTNGASSVVSGRTRIPIASADTFGITTAWYYYNSTNLPGYQVTAVTATYIEVNGTPTAVASGKAVIFGKPTTVTAGMSSFYLRLGANIYKNDPIFFNKENASEGYTVQLVSSSTTSSVTFSPAISTNSPAIGSSIVYIGGFAISTVDTFAFIEKVSKSGVATQNNIQFAEIVTVTPRRRGLVSDAIAFAETLVNQAKYPRIIGDTFSITDSTSGRSKRQNIYVTDAFSLVETIRRNLVVNLNDRFAVSEAIDTPLIGFTTPLVKITPPYLPETKGLPYMLFRHYAVREAHVNVYELQDGTFVQNYPSPENTNTNIPYPWNPSDPTAPYATVTNWNGTIERFYLPNPIVRVFYGGETTMVTQQEANKLRQAGYGNYLEV